MLTLCKVKPKKNIQPWLDSKVLLYSILFYSGPPFPPQDVQVQSDPSPGVLQVRWKPPTLTPSGTSNGASVIGYVVCTKGQKVSGSVVSVLGRHSLVTTQFAQSSDLLFSY